MLQVTQVTEQRGDAEMGLTMARWRNSKYQQLKEFLHELIDFH